MNGIVRRMLATVFSGLCAGLVGLGLCATMSFAQSKAKTMYIIDYAHESAGILHHGTLSRIDGAVRVTWTIDEGGKRRSRDVPMTEEAFTAAWAALNEVPEFRNAITDPDEHLNVVTHHIVGIVFRVSGQEEMRTFAIPASSASTEFNAWLAKIRETEK
jgi:hypothetical protein